MNSGGRGSLDAAVWSELDNLQFFFDSVLLLSNSQRKVLLSTLVKLCGNKIIGPKLDWVRMLFSARSIIGKACKLVRHQSAPLRNRSLCGKRTKAPLDIRPK